MTEAETRPLVILLAEDDPGDQELIGRALTDSRIVNELHIVEDGEEALDYLTRQGPYGDPQSSPRPDLVFMDLNMPRLDGNQVLARMSEIPDLAEVKVVMLSTAEREDESGRGRGLRADRYITKPIDFDEFTGLIEEALSMARQMLFTTLGKE